MGITYDPDKRARTLQERGLDFEDAPIVFAGLTVVVIGYAPRGADRHIFSMRKANRREQDRLAPYFGL
jgi:hypothetical protein